MGGGCLAGYHPAIVFDLSMFKVILQFFNH